MALLPPAAQAPNPAQGPIWNKLPDIYAHGAARPTSRTSLPAFSTSPSKAGATLITFDERQAAQAAQRVLPYKSWVRTSSVLDDLPKPDGFKLPNINAVVFKASRSGMFRAVAASPPPRQQQRAAPARRSQVLMSDAGLVEGQCDGQTGVEGVDMVNGKLVVGPSLPLDADGAAPTLAGHKLSAPTISDINYILGKWNNQSKQDRQAGKLAAARGEAAGAAGPQVGGDGGEGEGARAAPQEVRARCAAGSLDQYGAVSQMMYR